MNRDTTLAPNSRKYGNATLITGGTEMLLSYPEERMHSACPELVEGLAQEAPFTHTIKAHSSYLYTSCLAITSKDTRSY